MRLKMVALLAVVLFSMSVVSAQVPEVPDRTPQSISELRGDRNFELLDSVELPNGSLAAARGASEGEESGLGVDARVVEDATRADVEGLQRAVLLVDNEEARDRIRSNIQRFEAFEGLPCNDDCLLQASEEGNVTRVLARERVRILGLFPADAVEEFRIEEGSRVGSTQRNFVRRLVRVGLAG